MSGVRMAQAHVSIPTALVLLSALATTAEGQTSAGPETVVVHKFRASCPCAASSLFMRSTALAPWFADSPTPRRQGTGTHSHDERTRVPRSRLAPRTDR